MPRAVDGIKVCVRCRVAQPVQSFHNNVREIDRRCPYCRSCKRIKKREEAAARSAADHEAALIRMAVWRDERAEAGVAAPPVRSKLPAAHGRKTCTRCGLDQDVAAFQRAARYDDGLNPRCRVCVAERRAEVAAERSGQDEVARERQRAAGRRHYWRHRERISERRRARRAASRVDRPLSADPENVRRRRAYAADPALAERARARARASWARKRASATA